MTTEPEAAAVATPQPAAAERYASFAELRTGHLDLRTSFPEMVRLGAAPGAPGVAEQLRRFLAKAQKTGAVLVEPSMRKAAQGILDYWCAELAGLPDATQQDFIPITLAPPDISSLPEVERTAGDDSQTTPRKEEQRSLIRLSGTARQWRNANKQPGYLLTGEALEEARTLAQQDADLLEFVEASEAAEAARKQAEEERRLAEEAAEAARKKAEDDRKRRQANVRWAFAVTLAVFLAVFGSVWYFSVLTKVAARFILQGIAQGTVDSTHALRLLDLIQPFTPPYDLSGSQKFADINLPGLTLYAPNFSGVEFSGVRFPNAKLPAASFSGSDFSFKDGRANNFSGAELRQAQFRNAKIASTSFAGADLYRAVFDRAVLCNVDFSEANLTLTSFWSVTTDAPTKAKLKDAAWGLAIGWSWEDIESLASNHPPTGLKSSSGFKADIKRPIDKLNGISLSSLERAVALNDLAWTRAIWGVDIAPPRSDPAAPKNEPAPDPCAATGIPASAREASEQAVCIVGKLNNESNPKGAYTDLLSNLRDTLAYVQMQNKEIPAALATFGEIGKDNAAFLDNKDVMFRYAIAQYADAKNDEQRNAAIAKFTDAVDGRRYQPTHELQNLKDYIFKVDPFKAVLEMSTNRLWPPIQYSKNADQPGPVKPACPPDPKPVGSR